MFFANRQDAGRQLAQAVTAHRPDLAQPGPASPPLVLGLPRGGVVLAAEVANALQAPLDLVVVTKVGHPEYPEMAIGAVDPDGRAVLFPELDDEGISAQRKSQTLAAARAKWELRSIALRGGRPAPDVRGRTVILVDDGIATGATAKVALEWLRRAGAAELLLAVPVAPRGVERRFAGVADQLICPHIVAVFHAVGQFYADFRQVTDDEVRRLLPL